MISATLSSINIHINILEINSRNILLKPGNKSEDLVYIFDIRSGIGIRGYDGKTYFIIYGEKENNIRKRCLFLQGNTV